MFHDSLCRPYLPEVARAICSSNSESLINFFFAIIDIKTLLCSCNGSISSTLFIQRALDAVLCSPLAHDVELFEDLVRILTLAVCQGVPLYFIASAVFSSSICLPHLITDSDAQSQQQNAHLICSYLPVILKAHLQAIRSEDSMQALASVSGLIRFLLLLCRLLAHLSEQEQSFQILGLLTTFLSEWKPEGGVPQIPDRLLDSFNALLHFAVTVAALPLIQLLVEQYRVDVNAVLAYSVRLLFDDSPKPAVMKIKLTPLHVAFFVGSLETAQALIALGAVSTSLSGTIRTSATLMFTDLAQSLPALHDWLMNCASFSPASCLFPRYPSDVSSKPGSCCFTPHARLALEMLPSFRAVLGSLEDFMTFIGVLHSRSVSVDSVQKSMKMLSWPSLSVLSKQQMAYCVQAIVSSGSPASDSVLYFLLFHGISSACLSSRLPCSCSLLCCCDSLSIVQSFITLLDQFRIPLEPLLRSECAKPNSESNHLTPCWSSSCHHCVIEHLLNLPGTKRTPAIRTALLARFLKVLPALASARCSQ